VIKPDTIAEMSLKRSQYKTALLRTALRIRKVVYNAILPRQSFSLGLSKPTEINGQPPPEAGRYI